MSHSSKTKTQPSKANKSRKSTDLPDPVYTLGTPLVQAKPENSNVGSNLYGQLENKGVIDNKGVADLKASIPDPRIIFQGATATEIVYFIERLGNVTLKGDNKNNDFIVGNMMRVIPQYTNDPVQQTFQEILVRAINRKDANIRASVDNRMIPFDDNTTGGINMNKMRSFTSREIGVGTKLGKLIQMSLISHMVTERAATPLEKNGHQQFDGKHKKGEADEDANIDQNIAHAAGEGAEKEIFDAYFKSLGRPEVVILDSFTYSQQYEPEKKKNTQIRGFSTKDAEGNLHTYYYKVTFNIKTFPDGSSGAGSMTSTETNLPT